MTMYSILKKILRTGCMRMKRKKVWILSGIPGSGKTTWAKEQIAKYGGIHCSRDEIRFSLLKDGEDYFAHEDEVIRLWKEKANQAILSPDVDNVYIDATHLTEKTRAKVIDSLPTAEYEIITVFFHVPLEVCLERNSQRDRKVPYNVIERMYKNFDIPWYNEGWDIINVINCGKKQNIDREHARMLGEPHDNHHHSLTLGMHCNECVNQIIDLFGSERWSGAFNEREVAMLLEAAYQHDLGKHKTKAFFDSKDNPSEEAHFYSHNNVGAYLWLSGDKSGEWSKDEFLFIAQLIQWHMQPFFVRDKDGDYQEKFRAWCEKRNYKENFYKCISILHEADRLAH
jgi:predicted kinase